MNAWYKIENLHQHDTPALLWFKERIQHNITELLRQVTNVSQVRPHVKTSKSSEVCKMMLNAGIGQFKAATIAECEMLGTIDAPDVLLAYPLTETKAKRFLRLKAAFPLTRFSCLTDNIENAIMLATLAEQMKTHIDVFLDLDVGMHRTGINPAQAMPLFDFVQRQKHLNFSGLHAYDGHICDTDVNDRIVSCNAAFSAVEDLRKKITAASGSLPLLVAGGSPTWLIHANRANTQCSPGTFIFWDKAYRELLPEQSFLPAALLATRVISKPFPGTICLDLGHKAVAAEKPLAERISFIGYDNLAPLSQSEEHLVVSCPDSDKFSVGQILLALPGHVCPTVALYDQALVVSENKISASWQIEARQRTITF